MAFRKQKHGLKALFQIWPENLKATIDRRLWLLQVAWQILPLQIVTIWIHVVRKAGNEQVEAAKKVKMFFPNQSNRGVHINIRGWEFSRMQKILIMQTNLLNFCFQEKCNLTWCLIHLNILS